MFFVIIIAALVLPCLLLGLCSIAATLGCGAAKGPEVHL